MRHSSRRYLQEATIAVDRRRSGRRTAARKATAAFMAAAATIALSAVTFVASPARPAMAVTASQLQSARSSAAASRAREAQLRQQLHGVSQDLANKILQLNDLTQNQIPAAQEAAAKAEAAAQDASDNASAASDRLQAAQKDLATLQQKIRQTGKNYDDAHAAVAEVARDSMHGSSADDTMSILMGSRSTSDFIASMQSSAAVARSESTQANQSANDLSLSENREDRLTAIQERVATLKQQADQQAAAAAQASADAKAKQDQLSQLRDQGTAERASLEQQQAQLNSATARQAMQSVALASQVDSLNQQYAAQQAQAARQSAAWASQQQSYSRPSNNGSSYRPTPSQPSQGGGNGGGASVGGANTYPWGQCTWWAYQRRQQLGLWIANYMGNAANWAGYAASHGQAVTGSPRRGSVVVFRPGQDGASPMYGHVAIVESINGGMMTISESNARGLGVISSRTLRIAGHTFIY